MSVTRQYPMFPERRGPFVIEACKDHVDLSLFVAAGSMCLEEQLAEHGALLFRGFDCTAKDFELFVDALPYEKLKYRYNSTPRTALSANVYTATEYPADQHIPLHNENAYLRCWPKKLVLFCERPAQSGGETPIADMRCVTASIGDDLLDEFESRGVQYIRHYHEFIDIPWQVVFRCEDRVELAAVCAEAGIRHDWIDEKTLRTIQVCQGVAYHSSSEERVFFNQAHLFHSSSLGPERERAMCNVFGRERVPRHARFGDGGEIPSANLEVVRASFATHAVSFPWRAGDVLLLDNMQFAHGRRPFKGERKVRVALLDPHTT